MIFHGSARSLVSRNAFPRKRILFGLPHYEDEGDMPCIASNLLLHRTRAILDHPANFLGNLFSFFLFRMFGSLFVYLQSFFFVGGGRTPSRNRHILSSAVSRRHFTSRVSILTCVGRDLPPGRFRPQDVFGFTVAVSDFQELISLNSAGISTRRREMRI